MPACADMTTAEAHDNGTSSAVRSSHAEEGQTRHSPEPASRRDPVRGVPETDAAVADGLANAIHVPPRRINEIVLGKRAIMADTDLRLARYFGMSEGFFLRLQTDYELMARRRQIADQLKAIRPRAA